MKTTATTATTATKAWNTVERETVERLAAAMDKVDPKSPEYFRLRAARAKLEEALEE